MLSGAEIADRIEFLMKTTPNKTATELGGLFCGQADLSPQAKRKRYATFLRRLREEKIIRELRVTAEYMGVIAQDLLGEESYF